MRALLGIFVLLGLTFLMSFNRKKIRWDQVFWGLCVQGMLALTILHEGIYGRLGLLFFLYLGFSYNLWRLKKEPELNHKLLLPGLISFCLFTGISLCLGWIQQKSGIISIAYQAFIVFLIVYLFLKCTPWKAVRDKKWANILGMIFVLLASALVIADKITGAQVVESVSAGITTFLNSNRAGSQFIFGKLLDGGFVFAFSILSSTAFFASFMSMMDYLGVISHVVNSMARFTAWSMKIFGVKPISGLESLIVTANVFFSMQATPLMVRRYLPNITKSEVSTIIVAGLATIAGGTMALFINLGVPAAYLLSASVMSAPAAICLSKILYPETETPETLGSDMTASQETKATSLLGAATDGILIGSKSGLMISVMVMGFISLIAMGDLLLSIADQYIDGRWLPLILGRNALPIASGFAGIIPSSFAQIFGFLGMPLAWLLGTPVSDMFIVGELLGLKIAVNESIAYVKMLDYMSNNLLTESSILITSYALCGFANIGSLGILIGVMTGVVPERKDDFINLGIRGLFVGAFASFMTAAFASLIL